MKKLIIAVLLVISVSVFAQKNEVKKGKSGNGNKEMRSPEGRAEARLKSMTADLNLDANQQAQMKQVIAEQTAKREAKKAERMAGQEKAKPSKEEHKAMKAKRNEDIAIMDARVKAILDPSQFEKYKANEEANKANMKEKGKKGSDNAGDE
ncbi:hypothetical protein [uncultured Flavobacterium sp.]|jgi:periplasmic protein CpxP/Spy|uniref:hypothetical protein n=1 Tax=uncultured Flavobacterium sp. TaxID=165435 RepID=UPI0030CA325F